MWVYLSDDAILKEDPVVAELPITKPVKPGKKAKLQVKLTNLLEDPTGKFLLLQFGKEEPVVVELTP